MKEIRAIIEAILKVYESDEIGWEIKYKVIFSYDLHSALQHYGLSVDWLDLDTSYREDVSNYVRGITDLLPTIDALEKALGE